MNLIHFCAPGFVCPVLVCSGRRRPEEREERAREKKGRFGVDTNFHRDKFVSWEIWNMVLCLYDVVFVVVAVAVVINLLMRRRTVSSCGKAVLITGCDSGFGFMLAESLDGLGYRVFATCLDAKGEGATHLKRKTSPNLVIIQLDVTCDEQVLKARKTIENQLQNCRLWALVNNAGIATFAETEWCSLEMYKAIMDVNYLGTIRVTKSFLPLIRAARGRVINIASLAGRVALPGFSAYSASKFAVVGFSDSLRREMKKFRVKVITIEPSLYSTALTNRDTLTQQNVQMWKEAPPEVRHQYGKSYLRSYLAKMVEMLHHSNKNTNEVQSDLVHAVTSHHPYTRYVPSLFKSQIPTDTFSLAPNLFQDMVLVNLLKVPATPAVMCATSKAELLQTEKNNT